MSFKKQSKIPAKKRYLSQLLVALLISLLCLSAVQGDKADFNEVRYYPSGRIDSTLR
jgi:hypothetical protein